MENLVKKVLRAAAIALLGMVLFAMPVLAAPGAVTSFVGVPSNTSIYLQWVIGTASTSTVIRYDTSAYPATEADGTGAYSGADYKTTVTGLTAGTTYYFSAFSFDGALYGAATHLLLTTTAFGSLSLGDNFPTPTMGASYVQVPTGTGLKNLEPFYTMMNTFISDWQVPNDTGWTGIVLVGIVGISVLLAIVTKGLFVGYGVSIVLLFIAVAVINLPWWMLTIPVALALGTWAVERYAQ